MSIQENPFPGTHIPSPEERKAVLTTIRRNIGFIFSGVSRQHAITSENDLATIRIRHLSNSSADESSISQEDGSSLLFYYIFDDWVTSYGLVARREHKYAAHLDKVVSSFFSAMIIFTRTDRDHRERICSADQMWI